MATGTFLTQHGDSACDRAGEPQQDMNAHHCQKDWISGRISQFLRRWLMPSVTLMHPAEIGRRAREIDPSFSVGFDGRMESVLLARMKALMNLPSTSWATASTSMPLPARNSRASAIPVDPSGFDAGVAQKPAAFSLDRYSPSSRAPAIQPTQSSMPRRSCSGTCPLASRRRRPQTDRRASVPRNASRRT